MSDQDFKGTPGRMLGEAVLNALQKPATVDYPFVKVEMPKNFRGKLKFIPEKCVGCKLCMKDCPAGAIDIVKVGDKLFEARIDLDKCIYCAQCVDSCVRKALEATADFELAQLDKQELKVVIKPTAQPVAPSAPATTASAAAPGTVAPTAAPATPAAGTSTPNDASPAGSGKPAGEPPK